jgi:hypothetical protein
MSARIRLILILAFGAYLCASCQQISTPPPAIATPASESTATSQPDPDIDQILIIDHTRVNNTALLESDLAEFQQNTPLALELVTSFQERNQQPYPLEPVLDFGVEYQLLTQEYVDELRHLDEASGWKLLYEKYPNSYGFVYLSRVGFNADFSQALVYMDSFHYEQPIQGGNYLMIKQNGRWVIESGYEWIS